MTTAQRSLRRTTFDRAYVARLLHEWRAESRRRERQGFTPDWSDGKTWGLRTMLRILRRSSR